MHLADFTLGYFGGNGIVGAGLGHRDGRRRWRRSCARRGQVARRLLRRRRRQHRADVGGGQHRRGLEASADRVLREQPVRGRDVRSADRPASGSIARRAEGFGLPAVQVDGQDVCAVYRAVRAARERAAARRRADVHRGAHLPLPRPQHRRDDELPRADDEVEQWRADRDPIERLRRALETAGRLEPRAVRGARGARPSDGSRRRDRVRGGVARGPTPRRATTGVTAVAVDLERTASMSEQVTVGQAFQQGMREEMARDETIFVLGTDLSSAEGTSRRCKGIGPGVRARPRARRADLGSGDGRRRRRRGDERHAARWSTSTSSTSRSARWTRSSTRPRRSRYLWGKPVPLVIRASSGIALYAAQHNNSLEAWFAHTPGPGRGDAVEARGHEGHPQVGAAGRRPCRSSSCTSA